MNNYRVHPTQVLPGAEFLALGGFETHETLLRRRVLDIHMTKASVDAARGGRIHRRTAPPLSLSRRRAGTRRPPPGVVSTFCFSVYAASPAHELV